MNFIVKDLMITVLPEKFDIGKLGSLGDCMQDSSGPPCSGLCPGTRDPITAIGEWIALADNPVTLSILRDQLKQHIVALDERASAVRENILPLTETDKATLSSHLADAMQELDASAQQ